MTHPVPITQCPIYFYYFTIFWNKAMNKVCEDDSNRDIQSSESYTITVP